MLAHTEPVFEANLKKVKPAQGETRAQVDEYFRHNDERLKTLLRQAIDRKGPGSDPRPLFLLRSVQL
jgi:hypothetical protein